MTTSADKLNPLIYNSLKGLVYVLSLIPFWVLYRISDILFVTGYYLIGYRKQVVMDNLRRAFPENPESTNRRIARRFYQHLSDLLVETLKGASLSAGELEKRMPLLNPEVMDEVARQGKGTLIIASHYGNFEWTNACIDYFSGEIPTYSIYHKLKNPYFEALMQGFRGRWGTVLIDKHEAFRQSLVRLKKLCMIGFMSDQSPSRREVLYFTRFLGQPSAMHEGAAMLAVGRNLPAYFADVRKVKRGHYSCRLIPIPTEQFAAGKDVHGFTDYYAQLLEEVIREEPAYWLWSHRRWKHSPREGDELSPLLENAIPSGKKL